MRLGRAIAVKDRKEGLREAWIPKSPSRQQLYADLIDLSYRDGLACYRYRRKRNRKGLHHSTATAILPP